MDIPSLAPSVRPDHLPLERLAGNPQLTEAEKVREVARQFEALLLRQILAEARKGLHSDGLGEQSATLGIYHDLINQTLADSISRSGTLGLASSLQSELTRQTAAPAPPSPDHHP
jgi:flagellar protein FlgJ